MMIMNKVGKQLLRSLLKYCLLLIGSLPLCGQYQRAYAEESSETLDVLVIVGAAGEAEFGDAFAAWARQWKTTCDRANLALRTVGIDIESSPQSMPGETTGSESTPDEARSDEALPDSALTDQQRIQTALAECAARPSIRPLWVILIGHGTWDGATANFNLVGPDLAAQEFKKWLDPVQRPLVIVNCSSSSGPFINHLSAGNRVVVTATKSGAEQNFARFGQYFAAAFNELQSDLDHDDAISVREAFIKAANDVDRFYQEQGRLTTEHALLDDNDDKKGSTPALVMGQAKIKGDGEVDGDLAGRLTVPAPGNSVRLSDEQLLRRDELETKLRTLQGTIDQADRAALRQLALPILLELAELYKSAAETQAAPPPRSP